MSIHSWHSSCSSSHENDVRMYSSLWWSMYGISAVCSITASQIVSELHFNTSLAKMRVCVFKSTLLKMFFFFCFIFYETFTFAHINETCNYTAGCLSYANNNHSPYVSKSKSSRQSVISHCFVFPIQIIRIKHKTHLVAYNKNKSELFFNSSHSPRAHTHTHTYTGKDQNENADWFKHWLRALWVFFSVKIRHRSGIMRLQCSLFLEAMAAALSH